MNLENQSQQEGLQDLLDLFEDILGDIYEGNDVLFITSTILKTNQLPLFQILYNQVFCGIHYNINKPEFITFTYDLSLGVIYYKEKIIPELLKEKFRLKILPQIIMGLKNNKFEYSLMTQEEIEKQGKTEGTEIPK